MADQGPPPTLTRRRRSARVILVNSRRDVLLIRFVVERQNHPFIFWATPGGEVESNETDIDAARRELQEELGLDIDLAGPVHKFTSEFEHEGSVVSNTDVFFVGRCDAPTPDLQFATQAERVAMKELRWWPIAELERTEEVVFPSDLSKALEAINR